MLRKPAVNRAPDGRPAAGLSWLVVATLVCTLLPACSAPSAAAPTQPVVASALATVPVQTATAPARTVVATATQAPSASVAPTEAATPETAVTGTTVATGSPATLDPCTLVQGSEVQALIGAPVGKPKALNGGCLFADAATGISQGAAVYALPAAQAQLFLQPYVTRLKQIGVKVDPTAEKQLEADIASGDTAASVKDLLSMTDAHAGYFPEKLDGPGSVAMWSPHLVGQGYEMTLVAANPGALVALVVEVSGQVKEGDIQGALQSIARRIMAGLPASFTVADPVAAGSARALDVCSLVSASDAEVFLGVQTTDGASSPGACQFQDAATHKLLAGLFVYPAGPGAQQAIGYRALLMVGNDPTTLGKVDDDLLANHLVAAVRDMIGPGQSANGQSLQSVKDLGDAALFYSAVTSGGTLDYLIAAKPDLAIGLDLVLPAGDNAAIMPAAVGLLTRVINNLPSK